MSVGAKRAFRTGRRVALVGAACAALSYSLLLLAYSPFQDQVALTTGNVTVPTRWPTSTVTWYLNPSTPRNNVNTTSGTTISQALTSAVTVWQQTKFNGQILNSLTIVQGPDKMLPTAPVSSDCLNVVGFSDTSTSDFPTGTIAFTQVSTATADGQSGPPFNYTNVCGTNFTANFPSVLIDADMEFNPNQNFSTSTAPPANNFDLQAVASHEFGHLLGLDHSGIAHAMMFPFGDTGASEQRTLVIDDVMGVAFLYPGASFATTGTISGKVTLGASGIFAAHVVAVDTSTGNVVLDGLTNADGTYRLVGVPPGTYSILVLPLAPDVNSGVYTLDDFSGWACGYGENSAPCCDPKTDPTCTGKLQNPTNYSGTFY